MYKCDHCQRDLLRDHLLGQANDIAGLNARACDATCIAAWEASRPYKTTWTWRLISEWVAGWRLGSQPFYIQPPDDVPVWRYVDLAKVLDLIQTSELFLTAGHLLGDPYEGSLSEATLREFEQMAAAQALAVVGVAGPGYDVEAAKAKLFRMMRGNYEWERQWTYANCWHMNEHESAAMWAAYGSRQDAIAIRSSVARLRKCLEPHRHPPMGEPILAAVHYVDFGREAIKTDVHMAAMLHKRKSFVHECEVRILVRDLPLEGEPCAGGRRQDMGREPVPGIRLAVDLTELVEEIYVSPHAPAWLLEALTGLVRKYGLAAPVRQSSLLEGAVF